jgi:hypothetical protein
MSALRVYPEFFPTGALASCHPRPELTTHCRFLELGILDVSHAALEAMHLVVKARGLDLQNGHTPSPFLMELPAPKQSCSAHSEKTGAPEVTVSEDFYDLFSDQEVKITGWKRA